MAKEKPKTEEQLREELRAAVQQLRDWRVNIVRFVATPKGKSGGR